MSFRGRRLLPSARLVAILAVLAAAAAGPVPALAGDPAAAHPLTPSFLRPDPLPEPRQQEPGQTAGFQLPFASGQDVRVYQGWNTTFSHNGKAAYAYDFGLYQGTDVLAAAAGIVAFIHDGETKCGGRELRNKANYVTLYHPDGSATQYGHLSAVGVKVGDVVAAGQVIGKSGDTGYTQCLPHLHFARQYEGSGVTQSVPVYFEGYASRQFVSGDLVSRPAGGSCATSTAASPDGATTADVALGSFCGAYFQGTFDDPTAFVRSDPVLNFDWRSSGPGGYWLDDPGKSFSARWSGAFVFPSAGTYIIGAMWSGQVKVSIDGVPLIDRWADQAVPGETLATKALGAGTHRVDVEYLSPNGHGLVKLGWGRMLADE